MLSKTNQEETHERDDASKGQSIFSLQIRSMCL